VAEYQALLKQKLKIVVSNEGSYEVIVYLPYMR